MVKQWSLYGKRPRLYLGLADGARLAPDGMTWLVGTREDIREMAMGQSEDDYWRGEKEAACHRMKLDEKDDEMFDQDKETVIRLIGERAEEYAEDTAWAAERIAFWMAKKVTL